MIYFKVFLQIKVICHLYMHYDPFKKELETQIGKYKNVGVALGFGIQSFYIYTNQMENNKFNICFLNDELCIKDDARMSYSLLSSQFDQLFG